MLIELLAAGIAVSDTFVINMAHGASFEYKTYEVPKATGGTRTIHHPSKRLKALQRWLLRNVISHLPLHAAAAAYRPGWSTWDHAMRHAASRYLLRMDFSRFFESITRADIVAYATAAPDLFTGWTADDLDVFCRLVCRHGALTVGSPSSPAISNALCYELDTKLTSLAQQGSCTYSRYADDLFFSTARPGVLNRIAEEVPRVLRTLHVPAALTINQGKTRHSSSKGRRRVTGITLGSDGNIHIGRHVKRRIRALIHTYDSLSDHQRSSLAGWIAYASGNDPEFLNSLILKYGPHRVKAAASGQPA